jgi:tetratricopeptide (TPR) repeat protein
VLGRIVTASTSGSEAATQARLDAHFDALDAHTDYLVRACELADRGTRLTALSVLERRALRGDAPARQALPGLLVGLGGPDADRTRLLQWLDEHGLHDPATPVTMRAGEAVREVRSVGLTITTEPRPSTLSKAGLALAERMNAAGQRGALAEARKLGQQLLELHPGHPMALSNLAGILQALGEPHAEVMRLYREALAQDPDYLFARCGLAFGLVQEGRLDEARELLDGLIERGELHLSEFRTLSMVQRAIAQAAGEHATVRAIDQVLQDLERQFG